MAEVEKKSWKQNLAIGSIIAALGIGVAGTIYKDEIVQGYGTRVIQQNALKLENRIKTRADNKEFKLYADLKPQFRAVEYSFNITEEFEIQMVLTSITQILSTLNERKNAYGKGNDEYNYIIQSYEPDLKEYFKYVLNNLKNKFPNNTKLKEFKIK